MANDMLLRDAVRAVKLKIQAAAADATPEELAYLGTAIDRIGPEWHDLSKRAKDMGSAAVLLSLLLCLGIWLAAAWARWA